MWITVVFVFTICIMIPSTLSDKDVYDYSGYSDNSDYSGYNDYGNCHDHCSACNDNACTMCKEGWYGEAEEVSGEVALTCDQPCPTPCKSGYCDGQTGHCKDGCKHGHYGKRCEGNCKQICVYGECDLFGNCTIDCEAGTFGPRCDAYCPQRCKDKICDVLNGSCSKGCAGNFYGAHCNMTCPYTCNTIAIGSSCHAESGSCLAGCLNGFYGQRCSDVCQHCVNNTCQKDDGVCVHGCIIGYRLDVSVQKCLYAGSITKALPVYAVVVIAVGCVVIVVVVIGVIVHRTRRRTESRSIETPMKAVDNAIYETCETPSDTTVDCYEDMGIGRVDNPAYKYNGNSDLQNPVPKAKTYKRSTDLRGQGKHHESQFETLAADQPGLISPNAEVFRGDDGYKVPFPSTSGRNAVDENDANIYSEPDERCFGPKDYIE